MKLKIRLLSLVTLICVCSANAQFSDEISKDQIHAMGLTGICYQDVRRAPVLSTINNSTSFFIEKNFLLTSAHNVTKLPGHKAKIVTIYPARIHDTKEFDSIILNVNYRRNIRYPESYNYYRAATRKPHDMALIYITDEQINANPKLKDIAYLPLLEDTASLKVGDTLYCAGYPAEKEYNGQYVMTMDTSVVSSLNDNYFGHQLETVTGNSGSPIMVRRDGKFYVVGINSIEYAATWINDEKKALIKKWMAELKPAAK